MMKAIEIESKTDSKGFLKVSYPLNQKEKKVKVIIMFDDTQDEDEEMLWMKTVSKNPAFDFLNDEVENVYSFEHGEPIDD
jgi:hypothetical protein